MSHWQFKARHELTLVDRYGDRDAEWNRSYGFARLLLETIGARCLACGRRLWRGEGTRRIYCDDVCHRRHKRRRERYRATLRRLGARCPYCHGNGHTMVTKSPEPTGNE